MMEENYQDDSALFFEPPIKKDAKYYRRKARECLKGSFWKLLLMLVILWACVALICTAASFGMQALMNQAASLKVALAIVLLSAAVAVTLIAFLLSPIAVAIGRAFFQTVDGEPIRISDLLIGFGNRFGANFVVGLLVASVLPIAMLLAVVGYVIFDLSLANASPLLFLGALMMILAVALLVWALLRLVFVFQIRAEYPELGVADTLRNSITLTKSGGRSLRATSLSFIGWYALALLITVLTDGIGSIALCPVLVYHQTAMTLFYCDVSQRDKVDEVEFPSIDPEDYDPDSVNW